MLTKLHADFRRNFPVKVEDGQKAGPDAEAEPDAEGPIVQQHGGSLDQLVSRPPCLTKVPTSV